MKKRPQVSSSQSSVASQSSLIMNNLKYALLFLVFSAFTVKGQIIIEDNKKLEKIKKGNTYIMVGSTKFPGADEYLKAVKKDWTLSKGIDYLSPDNPGNISPDDSFLSLEALTETRGSLVNIYYYLSFWTCKESYFKKKRDLKRSDHELVAKVCLSVDPKAFAAKSFFKDHDFDGGGLLHNWSPGMLRNYLQQLTRLLNTEKKVKVQDDILNKAELVNLSKETLYVPDFNLLGFSPFLGRKKAADEEKIFEDYPYPYKIVSKAELDQVILDSDKPSYYLIFIKDSSNKVVCVVNSNTGETVYSNAKSFSYNLKSGDVKDLLKEINRK